MNYKYILPALFVFGLAAFSARADMNVAVITPTSGDFKYFSEELINGAKVAVDEINETGGLQGKKVNLVQIDDPCDDTLSLTTAEMIAVNRSSADKMQLVIGPQCYHQTEKIARLFAAAEIFQIHPTGSSRALYLGPHPQVVEMVGFTEQQGIDFFRYYARVHASRRLAVVYDGGNPELTEIAREIQHHFTKAGMGDKLTAFSTEPFAGDSEKIVEKVRSFGAEALFMMTDVPLMTETIRALKADNDRMEIFVNRYFGGRRLISELGQNAEGIYVISLPSLNSSPEFAEDLVKLRLLGIEPVGLMAYGYLAVRLWSGLVEAAGSFNYDKLQKKLDKQLVTAGWGNVVYTSGVPDRSLKYAIFRYENGEYTQVW